jgi:hypothetical protein
MSFDLFTVADPALQPLAFDQKVSSVEPLPVSSWVAASVVQKAIRRGEVDLATRAAAALLIQEPAKLWRRLAGIVFEDIGLADVSCVRLVMAATAGKSVRQQHGGDHRVAALLVLRMCEAKKCRSADDLFIAVSHHHELTDLRASFAGADVAEHLSRIRQRSALLGASLSLLYASGVRWNGQVSGRKADAPAAFAAMQSAGMDQDVLGLAEQGFRRTREALPLLVPLLKLALPPGVLHSADDEFPPVVIGRNGIPTYCYDRFSWEGKAALARFLKRDLPTTRWLRKHVPAQRHGAILAGGLFRVEGGLVRQRVEWPCALTLRWLADSGFHSMKLPEPRELLDMIRSDLSSLNEERDHVGLLPVSWTPR